MEKRYYTKDGHLIWVLLAVAIVREEDGSPRHFISQIQDISARKRLEAHTYELANRDPITSLYNRRRFEEELQRQIARCRDGRRERGAAAARPRPLQERQRLRRPHRRRPPDPAGRAGARRADRRPRRRGADRRRRVRRDPPRHRPRPGARRSPKSCGWRSPAPTPSATAPPASASAGCTATCPTPRPASAPSTGRCTGRRARAATGWSSARSPSAGRRRAGARGSWRPPAGARAGGL